MDNAAFEEARARFFQGVAAHEAGDLPAAERHFEAALQSMPGRVSVLTNLAATRLALGRPAEALPLVEQALVAEPGRPDLLVQHAVALHALGRDEDALVAVDAALQQDAAHAARLRLRADLLAALQRHEASLATHAALLALVPDDAGAWLRQGQSLMQLRRVDAALASFRKAVELAPADALAWSNVASALSDLGRRGEAIEAFERAIASGGDAEMARYHIAALRGDAAPASAPAAYVRALFDGYAEAFDTHLVGVLGYAAPERLVRGLEALPGFAPGPQAQALDLGCGTGLCGPLLVPLYASVDGVDLSAPMLERARARGVYRNLVVADVVDHLNRQSAVWDLVLAADLFVYIGDLVPVFEATAFALRSGGYFSFSVEAADDAGPDFVLQPSMRYAQSAASLRRLALRHGFEVLQMTAGPIRNEQQHEIAGLYVHLRKV